MEQRSPGSGTPNSVGQMFRFAKDIHDGDFILTPEKATGKIHVSRCKADYHYNPSVFGAEYPHTRSVEYLRPVQRNIFPQSIRNTLGSVLTVFRADAALPFLVDALQRDGSIDETPSAFELPDVEVERDLLADEVEGHARGQILEALDDIEHHDFQLFIAGLLEAIGYKARVGQKGKDGGVDILAFPDVFGLSSPRVKVQVKNQKSLAGHPDVAQLNGVIGAGERGLFVCTGGFSNDAKNATFVKEGRVALVDGLQLLDLLLEDYDEISGRAKSLMPLRRIYIPE